ncbi:DoxX family protein [Fulvivirga ligni]|uniref:DoxX family protein n=1 Tax=Fulvivirga ligni TaxID=2904246 RepID=UPI001F2AA1D9|nr:DoxX family protein [Fulvivirga ligni]UII20442.1 DoxX family protein [Fulvivirga ligni]
MKNSIFKTDFNLNTANAWLLLLRIAIGALMLTHGLPKLQTLLSGGEIQFYDWLGLGATFSLVLAVFSEVICSALIIIGLGTRLATLPLIITMLVAIFMVHAGDPFGKQEFPLLYALIYNTLLVFGSGKYSIDHYLGKSKRMY